MKKERISPFRALPTQPIRPDELSRYLRVYDLKKQKSPKLKWREISKIIYPKKEWNKSLERGLYIDFNNAKRIIKNVEIGLFPGQY